MLEVRHRTAVLARVLQSVDPTARIDLPTSLLPLRPSSITPLKHRHSFLLYALLAFAAVAAVAPTAATDRASAYGVPMQTGIASYPNGETVITRSQGLGVQFLKLAVSWSAVAPINPPPGFEPANPEDPSYRWKHLDWVISDAISRRLTPVIDILEPPTWAKSPPGSSQTQPDLNAFAMFVRAIASRYDGTHFGLPRVSYWEAWNEPNVSLFLEPQIEGNTIVSVDTYRTMLNNFASIVHGIHSDNVVIGGALFPNGIRRPGITAIAPLDFTRRLFCISAGSKPHLVCNTKVNVDVWSVHPYTSGGPSTLPANRDNIWIADLSSLTSAVQAAQRLGSLASTRPAQVWVSEFSWDSNPPDPLGVPVGLERRWVAETLYRAWSAKISMFTWFRLSDDPQNISQFQSGLYFSCPGGGVSCDSPKPAAAAFRFPFVAYTTQRRRLLVWGRTPAGVRSRVRIQWLEKNRWQTFTTLSTDSNGIFTARPLLPRGASSKSAKLRAVRSGGEASPAFSLARPRDIAVTPFGS
ncbi:MAG TPA: hypothetical protein VGI26_01090 [Solirubrobacteraceae bacterium]|jgi:hypothetical protein